MNFLLDVASDKEPSKLFSAYLLELHRKLKELGPLSVKTKEFIVSLLDYTILNSPNKATPLLVKFVSDTFTEHEIQSLLLFTSLPAERQRLGRSILLLLFYHVLPSSEQKQPWREHFVKICAEKNAGATLAAAAEQLIPLQPIQQRWDHYSHDMPAPQKLLEHLCTHLNFLAPEEYRAFLLKMARSYGMNALYKVDALWIESLLPSFTIQQLLQAYSSDIIDGDLRLQALKKLFQRDDTLQASVQTTGQEEPQGKPLGLNADVLHYIATHFLSPKDTLSFVQASRSHYVYRDLY